MGIGYIIAVALVVLVVAACVRSIVRDMKRNSCGNSCSGNCAGCAGCGNGEDIIITVKRRKLKNNESRS